MTKLHTLACTAALTAALAGASRRADAGPSVIRDETLTDVGTTPVLGRGYSLATNTFQSICMKEIVKTKPSYDFKYKFEQIEESVADEMKRSGSVGGTFKGGGFGVSVNAKFNSRFSDARTSTSSTINILVSIDGSIQVCCDVRRGVHLVLGVFVGEKNTQRLLLAFGGVCAITLWFFGWGFVV